MYRKIIERGARPSPFGGISASFRGSMLRWAFTEKEVYAIVETCKRLDYMLLRAKGSHIFTDRRDFQFIFDPGNIDNIIARYKADKLQRWAMVLQMF